MNNLESSEEILRKSSDRLSQPRQPILTLTSSRLQILKTTLDNMEIQLETLRLLDKSFTGLNPPRSVFASGKASLFHTIERIKDQIRLEEKSQKELKG